MEDTIFISIPSYRDPDCADTIKDAFSKAERPDFITVGVFVQDDVPFNYAGPCKERVLLLQVGTEDAQGPCLARYVIETAIYLTQPTKQRFYLTIDAHTIFTRGWDTSLVREWNKTNDSRAILTTYPREYGVGRLWAPCQSSFLTASTWNVDGFPLYKLCPTLHLPARTRPMPSISWVAGLSFCLGTVISSVPYVHDVPYSFIGEETAMAIKYYTHGYNLYAPSSDCNVLQTTFRYGERPRFTTTIIGEKMRLKQASNLRLFTILCDGVECGTERTVQDFYKYSGIDCIKKQFSKDATRGITNIDTEEERIQKSPIEGGAIKRFIQRGKDDVFEKPDNKKIKEKEKEKERERKNGRTKLKDIQKANPLLGPPAIKRRK